MGAAHGRHAPGEVGSSIALPLLCPQANLTVAAEIDQCQMTSRGLGLLGRAFDPLKDLGPPGGWDLLSDAASDWPSAAATKRIAALRSDLFAYVGSGHDGGPRC